MPAKKTTPKKSAVPVEQTPDDMRTALNTKQSDLLEYRRGLAAGELANPRIITATRKDIARLKTALTAAEQSGKGEK